MPSNDFLRHLEIEVVALRAEVHALFVSHMAVGAFQLVAIVRRGMRILGLHVLGHLDQLLGGMALGAGVDVRGLGIVLIGTVAGLAL